LAFWIFVPLRAFLPGPNRNQAKWQNKYRYEAYMPHVSRCAEAGTWQAWPENFAMEILRHRKHPINIWDIWSAVTKGAHDTRLPIADKK